MILCPHPLRQSKFEESRDQSRPGSLLPKSKDPGYEVEPGVAAFNLTVHCLISVKVYVL